MHIPLPRRITSKLPLIIDKQITAEKKHTSMFFNRRQKASAVSFFLLAAIRASV